MIELSIQNISKYYGATKVFDSLTFELHSNARVGLIGKNGTGKTTIFKIIAGIEEYNDGNLSLKKGSTIGYLDQIPEYLSKTSLDVIKLAFEDLFLLESKLKEIEDKLSNPNIKNYDELIETYGTKIDEFQLSGGYEIDEKIKKICTGFKFSKELLNKDFSILSGGEKTRIILAKILLENPSILLLDEPSNHLDLESVEWLEEYLKTYKGCVLIISHDRYFLDNTVTEIYDLENGIANRYLGNYSYYVVEKERRILEQLEKYNQQQKKVKAMEEAIKRFRDWGTRADNESMFVKAKSMEKRIEKMDKVDRPNINNKKIGLSFDNNSRSGKEVVAIRKLSKSFDKVIFENVDLNIKYKDVIGLLGKNGSGKSTLIKMILNQEDVDLGTIKVSESAQIGYMEQEIIFENPKKNILETFKEEYILTELEARSKLAKFLFYADDVFKKVENLSGGEKVRLSLCMMMEEEINFLVLDEPTNHVDIDSREMIEQALKIFNGTILFISHDRYFIEQLATKIVEVDDKKINVYRGDYKYYKNEIEKNKELKVQEKSDKPKKVKVKKEVVVREKGINIFKQKEIEKLEEDIEIQEGIIKELEAKLLESGSDYNKLIEIQSDIDLEKDKLNNIMDKWMEFQS